jgi:hypothetical protein
MKKFTIFFLIALFLSFNMIIVTSLAKNTGIKEGFYKVNALNLSPNEDYFIENISFSEHVQVLIFDENEITIQTIRLRPQSPKYDLLPLQPNYRIAIVGDGEVVISQKTF